jgi:hypothetical protein
VGDFARELTPWCRPTELVSQLPAWFAFFRESSAAQAKMTLPPELLPITAGAIAMVGLFLTSVGKGVRPVTNSMATKTIIKPAKSPAAVGPRNHVVWVWDH